MSRPTCEACEAKESKTALTDGTGKYIHLCLDCEEFLLKGDSTDAT
ncbi:hypothetical protein [Paenibacillus apiarius]|uniref:Uncharacterized protein n=1 Tax=Paenibacillus apiarius TaxID=46240 RepID=A0ABT4DVH1_9BACL|nr:hypothetical protein [Paenibacillus apiarius]MCY9513293.1 hypothetical protein [Paenibacillus apiarius]MCY9521348.1 hypothetical protein [Paenibacillus apiarius]MCY9555575.1 hypothetical protein [Paenibacillus apiarius]MCY9560709.1 hypothetical protein [Paenibacillus apiarius]MCY9685040.1 hypothetical protein [Paenibacillus apiarius]